MSSAEFVSWMAFDRYEPIGTRTVPDLLALAITALVNPYRKRPLLPQDILADPLAPRRLSAAEESARGVQNALDYRRLRAERLAKMASAEAATETT